ncbi:MAG: DUF1203 domain-containing protein [Kordiimonas sp.]
MFQVVPLQAADFAHFQGKTDEELEKLGAKAYVAEPGGGYPCRLTLEGAKPGERVILLNYEHLPSRNPYQSRYAIFIREGMNEIVPAPGTIPKMIEGRSISVRAFNKNHMLVQAVVVDGVETPACFEAMLKDINVDYLHMHFAAYGCYIATVKRAE